MFYARTSRVDIFRTFEFFSVVITSLVFWYINVRENRRSDQEWKI